MQTYVRLSAFLSHTGFSILESDSSYGLLPTPSLRQLRETATALTAGSRCLSMSDSTATSEQPSAPVWAKQISERFN